MGHNDIFFTYHPLINFLYFGLVVAFSMFLMHPVSLAVSLMSSLAYALRLHGKKRTGQSMRYMLPMMLVAIIINPLFNHEGMTILTYLPSGNPLTLESMAYGIAAAVMLGCVITWFSCYTTVMTSDKFIYLFGRVLPSLSLILSMTLRFVPQFKAQFHAVSTAQRCVGRDAASGARACPHPAPACGNQRRFPSPSPAPAELRPGGG